MMVMSVFGADKSENIVTLPFASDDADSDEESNRHRPARA